MQINVSFTDNELQALLQLLDVAVKAGGLQVVGPSFVIQQKLLAAVQDSNMLETVAKEAVA